MNAETPLPKEELLLKLLKMTTSSHDGEALTAVRKANELLVTAGWDWEKLIRSKIIIVEDPFKSIGVPPTATRHAASYAPPPSTTSSVPPRPQPATPRAPPPPPPPPLVGHPGAPISSRTNQYVGWCHCCGNEVTTNKGFLFKSHNDPDWKVICSPCNTSATVSRYPAPRTKVKRKKSISDLA